MKQVENIHTSKDILNSHSTILSGKKIALCITGSVGAVESVSLARSLMRDGAEVFTVMTQAAQDLIGEQLLHWATGNPVIKTLTGETEHISLAGLHENACDLVIVFPTTANTISKIATGIDDTTVTTVVTTAIGSNIPVVIVPAMHNCMYSHPIVQKNLDILKEIGLHIISPRIEEGKAKVATSQNVASYCVSLLSQSETLKGKSVLITAGSSREYIDDIRYITNPSSGKMGIALAQAAALSGAEVTLICGKACKNRHIDSNQFQLLFAETVDDFHKTVLDKIDEETFDIFISSAALSDFKVDKQHSGKRSSDSSFCIELLPARKVISSVRDADKNIFICGFKAEVVNEEKHLIEKAYGRIEDYGADIMVANAVGKNKIFGSDTTTIHIIDKEKNIETHSNVSKMDAASKIIQFISTKLN